MNSSRAIRAADELQAMLREGTLPRLGLVDVGMGARLPLEMAVRVTLADLARTAARVDPNQEREVTRWEQLLADLERLHHMATAGKDTTGHA
jgi:hypothetical protein